MLLLLFIYLTYASLYTTCLDYVDDKEDYEFKINDFKNYLKTYCDVSYSEKLKDICEYGVEIIINDIKDDLLPDYINYELCDIFK